MTINATERDARPVEVSGYARDPKMCGKVFGSVSYDVEMPYMERTYFLKAGAEKQISAGETVAVNDDQGWRHFYFPEGGKLSGPMIYGPATASQELLIRRASNGHKAASFGVICVVSAVLTAILAPHAMMDGPASDPGLVWQPFALSLIVLLLVRKSLMACYFGGKHLNSYLKAFVENDPIGVDLPKNAHRLLGPKRG